MSLNGTITDFTDEGVGITYKLDCKEPHGGLLCEINTKRQNVKVVKTIDFGYSLFLDGRIQSTEKDEYIYHEAIVHGLMSFLDCPKKVLVLGGAEGYLVREILKWPSVQEIHQVDWDRTLVNLYQGYPLSEGNGGAYKSEKLKVFYEDAFNFLENCELKYDAIFVDLLDPDEDNLELFFELIELSMKRLSSQGGIIMNAGGCTPINSSCVSDIIDFLLENYKGYERAALRINVPSYVQPWCLLSLLPCGSKMSDELPEGLKMFDKETYCSLCYWSRDWDKRLSNFTTGKWIGGAKIGGVCPLKIE